MASRIAASRFPRRACRRCAPRWVVTVRSRTPSRTAICRAVSPSAATTRTSRSRVGQPDLHVAASFDAVGDPADGPRRRPAEHHLVVGRSPQRLQELDRVDVLVHEPVGADEQRAGDVGGIGVRAAARGSRARGTARERRGSASRRRASPPSPAPPAPRRGCVAGVGSPRAPPSASPASASTSMSGRSSISRDSPARTTGSGSTTTTPRRRTPGAAGGATRAVRLAMTSPGEVAGTSRAERRSENSLPRGVFGNPPRRPERGGRTPAVHVPDA